MRRWWVLVLAVAAAISAEAKQSAGVGQDAERLVARVGMRVEEFYARARTLTFTESIRRQHLESDMRPVGFARQLVYQVRIAWEPGPDGTLTEPSVLRQLVKVNGRAPRPRDEPECFDPEEVAPDSLAMLLPQNRQEYKFALAGRGREGNRDSLIIDFQPVSKGTPAIAWKDTCVGVDAPGWTRGRIWVDAERADVLRLDGHLSGMIDVQTPREAQRRGAAPTIVFERYDWSIRYREVQFDDPVERLTLPRVVDSTAVWRNVGAPRVRVTQEFSDYRRFITGARIVDGDDWR